jgi:phosphatidylinositol alpha-mannosyltransferase
VGGAAGDAIRRSPCCNPVIRGCQSVMKIAIVTQSYYPRPGGVTEHVHHSAEELRRRGHEVAIVTARFGSGSADEPGIFRVGRNCLVPMNGALVNMTVGFGLGRQLRAVLERFGPDIVHTHCPLVPTLPLLTLRALPAGVKIIGTFHAAAETNYAYRILRKGLGQCAERLDARIAVSHAARELAHAYFPGDYAIIPNGIDTSRFSPSTTPLTGFQDGAFNILFIGRLDKRKGLKHLIHGASLLAASTARRIRLIIVGEKGIRRLLLPTPDRRLEIVFTGVVSRESLARYYTTCDLFCSPATGNESFGIVLLEAMASGIPVIGTSIPGYLTVLRDRWNALVVPPRDHRAITDAMRECMDDPRLANRCVENGLNFVQQYSWDKIAAQLERLYEHTSHPRDTVTPAHIEQEQAPLWA